MSSTIRLATESDAGAVAAIYRPVVESTAISFEIDPPDANEMSRRISETVLFYPWLVYDIRGEIAGFAYATRHRVRAAYQWSVDTSVYVHPEFRRYGIGRGLYMCRCLGYWGRKDTSMHTPESVFRIRPASPCTSPLASNRSACIDASGTSFGAWHDVGWWQLALKERQLSLRRLSNFTRS